MDELPSDEAINNSNEVMNKEVATDNTRSTDVEVINKIQTSTKNMATNFNFAKDMLCQDIKTEESGEFSNVPGSLLRQKFPRMDFKTDQACLCSRADYVSFSPAEGVCVRYKVCPPFCSLHQHIKPLIRKNVTQKEMAFNRECKKLEVVWNRRGLPVDKETLQSAARKDAFDMSDLSDSLPSTSTTENKPSILRPRRMPRYGGYGDRMECSNSMCGIKLNFMSQFDRLKKLPASENSSSSKDQRCTDRFNEKPTRPPEWAFLAFCRDAEKKKRRMNEISVMAKGIQNYAILDQEKTRRQSMLARFKRISLDIKQERQNSIVKTKEFSFPNLSKLSQNVIQSSGWDSERNWNTDFQIQDLHVPLNSPVKSEENANKDDQLRALLESQKKLLEMRKKSLELIRANCKLKTLNSHRGVCSEDMNDESETVSTSEQNIEMKTSPVKECFREKHLKIQRQLCKRMLLKLRESVKDLRILRNRPLLSSVKSDKVVPD